MKHALWSKLKIMLVITLVVTALCLVYLITPLFGNKVLIVRSGSMTPTLPVGSLVAIRPNEPISSPLPAVPLYSPGDVISYTDGRNNKTVTTHRVLGYKVENNQVFYQTKGDANHDPDQSLVAERNVLGASFLSLPYLGTVFSFAKTKVGFLLLVMIPTLFVIILESWNIFKEIRKKRPDRYIYRKNFQQGPTFTALVPLLAVGLVFSQTSAYFSDTAVSTNNVLAAAEVFPTTSPTPTITPTPIPGIANHLVISEIQVDAGSGSLNDHDFVEIHNPTATPIDLNGLRLVKRTGSPSDTTLKSWTSTALVPAHGYYLWASSADPTYPTSINADTSTTGTLATNNSVALRAGPENSGAIIDAVSWHSSVNALTEGTEFSPNPGQNQSLERKAVSTSISATMVSPGIDEFRGNGYDTDNNLANFTLRAASEPQNSGSTPETP